MSSSKNTLARRSSTARAATDPRPDGPESGFLSLSPERARILLLVAARPAAFALTTIVVLALLTLLTSGSGVSGVSGAIAAGWLGVHQVPLLIGTTTLGLLPLLPTALLVWLAAREAARAVEPDCGRADLGWVLGATLIGPLLVTAICLAVADDAADVVALQPPNPLAAFAWVFVLYLIAAVAGIASKLRHRLFTLPDLPDWVVSGVLGAGRTMLRLLGCATVVVLISFFAHITALGEAYHSAGNAAGGIGLTVLSLVYLPNLVVQTVGVLVGSTAHIGAASFGLFSVVGGPIPALPLTIAVPTGSAALWWSVLMVLPAGVAVLGGLDNGRISTDRITAPWATLTSALLATLGLVALGVAAGGELGTFGAVGLDLPLFAPIVFGWLAVGGYIGLVFTRLFVQPVGEPPAQYLAAFGRVPADDVEFDADEYDHDAYYDGDYQLTSYSNSPAEFLDYDDGYRDDYSDSGVDYHLDDDRAEAEANYRPGDATEPDGALEAELVEEEPAVPTATPRHDTGTPEIIDAEVIEADAPEADRSKDR